LTVNKSYHVLHILLITFTTPNIFFFLPRNSESPLNEEKRFDFVLVFKEEEGSEWQPSYWWACGWGVC